MAPPHLDQLSITIAEAFAPLGRAFETIANNTGLKHGLINDHPQKHELFWFRPAGFQIFEVIFFFAVFRYLWTGWARGYLARVRRSYPGRKPAFLMDRIFGAILGLAFVLQVCIKISRPNPMANLLWMIMPCHVITFAYAWIFTRRGNHAQSRFIAAMMTMSSWGAVAATAFPDFSDQKFYFERVAFFVHHSVMLLAPHVWAYSHGLPELSMDLFLTYACGCTFFNFFVYTPACFLSGVNINYNMFPHQNLARACPFPLGSVWYRFFVPLALWIWGYVYYSLTLAIDKALHSANGSLQVSVSPEREILKGHHHHRSILSRSSSSSHSSSSSASPPPTEPSISASPSQRVAPPPQNGEQ